MYGQTTDWTSETTETGLYFFRKPITEKLAEETTLIHNVKILKNHCI